MRPDNFKRFLSVLEERMKDPDSADEILSQALRDKARIKHFTDRLTTYRDNVTNDQVQFGEAFLRVYNAHEAKLKESIIRDTIEETEEGEEIEKYSLLAEKRENREYFEERQAKFELSLDDNEETAKHVVDEYEEHQELSGSILSAADMQNAVVTAAQFLNNQSQADAGLNSTQGQFQGVANASDEIKSVATSNISYRDAVLNVRKKSGKEDVRPPKLNENYGPGKLSVDKQLAILTLAGGKVIAYEAKDFQGRFKDGQTYEDVSIKLTERGLSVKFGIERDKELEAQRRLEEQRKLEKERAREASDRAIQAVRGVIRDDSRTMGMGM
jgi:hypothetical protein